MTSPPPESEWNKTPVPSLAGVLLKNTGAARGSGRDNLFTLSPGGGGGGGTRRLTGGGLDMTEALQREDVDHPAEATSAGPLLGSSGYARRPLSPGTVARRRAEVERRERGRIGLAYDDGKDADADKSRRPKAGGAAAGLYELSEREDTEDEVLYRHYTHGAVVDGVDDLRGAATGLLARHIDNIDGGRAGSRPNSGGAGTADFFKSNKTYPRAAADSARTVDDRVTPQTLHTLLRSSRQKVSKQYPPPKTSKYYTTQMSGGGQSALERLQESLQQQEAAAGSIGSGASNNKTTASARPLHGPSISFPTAGASPAGGTSSARSRALSKPRESPAGFLARTNHSKLLPPSSGAASGGNFNNTFSTTFNSTGGSSTGSGQQNLKKALKATKPRAENPAYEGAQQMYTDLRLMEPPGLTAAHAALYHATEQEPPADQRQPLYSTHPSDSNSAAAASHAATTTEVPSTLEGGAAQPLADPQFTSAAAAPLVRTHGPPVRGRDPFNLNDYFAKNTSQSRTVSRAPAPGEPAGAVGGPPAMRRPPRLPACVDPVAAQRSPAGTPPPPADTAPARLTTRDAQEILVRMDESLQRPAEGGAESRRAAELAALDLAVTSAGRGDDVGLVERLVHFFGAREAERRAAREAVRQRLRVPEVRVPTGALLREYLAASPGAADGGGGGGGDEAVDAACLQHAEAPFSLVAATLSVSKEYERVARGYRSAHSTLGSGESGQARQAVINRLVSFDSSLVPQQYWITTSRGRNNLRAATGGSGGSDDDDADGGGSGTGVAGGGGAADAQPNTSQMTVASAVGGARTTGYTDVSHRPTASVPLPKNASNGTSGGPVAPSAVLFPSVRPVGRAQVYLLAETLDEMLQEDPRLLPTLADPAVAYHILPEAEGAAGDGDTDTDADADAAGAPEDRNPLLDEALVRRAEAAYGVYTQCSAHALRVLDVGFTELVRQLSSQCAERGALLDALKQMTLDIAGSHVRVLDYAKRRAYTEAARRRELRGQLEGSLAEQQRLQETAAAMAAEVERLREEHAALAAKAARLDELVARVDAKRRRFETHDNTEHALLLKEIEQEMLHAAGEALGDLYNTQQGLDQRERGLVVAEGGGQEAPSNQEPRMRAAEHSEAMQRLYQGSYALLQSLRRATESVDAVCAPLYDRMALARVSAKGNVASARWTEIARSVGAFEAEKLHHQRVFEVFCAWCDECQQQRAAAEAAQVRGGDFLETEAAETGAAEENAELLNESAASFMGSVTSDGAVKRPHDKRALRAHREAQALAAQERLKRDGAAAAAAFGGVNGLVGNRFVTAEDLRRMDVHDCTESEVNALFARDFDFKGYLHPPYRPPAEGFTLHMSDVAALLADVRAALEEMATRMSAVAESAVLRRGAEPPMKPPAHPQEPCKLCGRFDREHDEKRRRQEVMQLIAQEVKARMEEVKAKCQRAESEREEARAEARRGALALERQAGREAALKRQLEELVRNSRGRPIPVNKFKTLLLNAGVTVSPPTSAGHGAAGGSNRRTPTFVSNASSSSGGGGGGGTSRPTSPTTTAGGRSSVSTVAGDSGAGGVASPHGILQSTSDRPSRAATPQEDPAEASRKTAEGGGGGGGDDGEGPDKDGERLSPGRRETLVPSPDNNGSGERRQTREYRKSQSGTLDRMFQSRSGDDSNVGIGFNLSQTPSETKQEPKEDS